MTDPGEIAGGERSTGSRIAVIDKAVRVLDTLLDATKGLTPTEVAERMEVNRSTAFRLLTSLEQSGLLARDAATGRYRLGMRMLRYAGAVRLEINVLSVAEQVLTGLRDGTRQSAHLAVRDDWGARCVLREPGPDVDVLSWRTGEWLPLHRGAAPRALMSALSEAEVDRYFAESVSWRDEPEDRGRDDVLSDLARIRDRGWAIAANFRNEDVMSLASVVRGPQGDPVCAVGVSGLERNYVGLRLEETTTAVLAAAAEIGRRLRA